MDEEYLILKWGTLKLWNFTSEPAKELLKEYYGLGRSADGAATQHDDPRQKEILCELIDLGSFDTVRLDWDGREVSKDEAKKYVMEYPNQAQAGRKS